MNESSTSLLVIVGPTAAGKSDLAVRVAEQLDGEVVSADSMQVYRYFDIGTGKLPLDQRRGVPHHLIDVVDPVCHFSAAEFTQLADRAIEAIHARGRVAVVVGGSGLYVRVLLKGLFVAPAHDPTIRARHERESRNDGVGVLYERLRLVDAETAASVHPHDFVRISRALEVFEQTGQPISVLRAQHGFATPRYRAMVVGLQLDPSELRERIDARVDQMMAQGWLDEVAQLRERGYGETHPMGSLGYAQLNAHLTGSLDLDEALRQTKRQTWRFSRRQRGWFAQESVHWIDAAALGEQAAPVVCDLYAEACSSVSG